MGKYVKWSISSIIIAVVLYFSYHSYQNLKQQDIPLLKAIPQNSDIILKINNFHNIKENILNPSAYWEQLRMTAPFSSFDKELEYWDSLIMRHGEIANTLSGKPAILTLQKVNKDKYSSLLIIPYPSIANDSPWTSIMQSFNNFGSIRKIKYNNSEIIKLEQRNLFYARIPGILLISGHLQDIQKAIDQTLSETNISSDPIFQKLSTTEGKKTNINIYIRFHKLSGILSDIIKLKQKTEIDHFSQWVELDLQLKNDELLMTGFSAHQDTNSFFLNIFNDDPQPVSTPELLPYDVSMLLELSFSNFENTHNKYLSFLQTKHKKKEYLSAIEAIENTYHFDVQKDFFRWIGKEIALAYNGKTATDDHYFLVIRSNNIKLAQNKLAILAEKMSQSQPEQFMMLHQDYIIKRLAEPTLMKTLFGDLFSKMQNNYFVILKDYIIFANHPSQLQDLINTFYLKKTLAKNFNYQYFSDNIFENSNLYLYCNIRNAYPVLTSIFKDSLANYFAQNELVFRNFEGLGIQFSYSENLFFTNLYLKYNPSYQEVKLENWEFTLDTTAIGKPQIIKNHRSGKRNVIVFDASNQMYLLNHLGQLQWKIQLPDKPISDVSLIDFYKNSKYQYLFNSENYFYLIDLNGKNVEGFPVSLDITASSPVLVNDYDHQKKYRLIVALTDQKIYNYTQEGKKIEGWNKVQTDRIVKQAIQYFSIHNKDYLIAYDTSQRTYIVNRRGVSRIPVNPQFRKSKNNIFYENLTNKSKGIFLTTDPEGNLVYVAKNGKTKQSSFGNFTAAHYFVYGDINEDKDPDFIYLDQGQLQAFDRFKKHIFSYDVGDVSQPPLLFTIGRKAYIGILSDSLQEVRFYDNEDQAFEYITFAAKQGFVVTQLENNDKYNIITTINDKVYNFRLD
jgi:hypothetical protein